MEDFLVNHAATHVWCTPDQDRQAIIKPARLTPPGGRLNLAQVDETVVSLPEPMQRFHVYQVGQLHPKLINLLDIDRAWVKFSRACNERALMVDLYADTGIELPRFESYYMVTSDKNLIIAVRELPVPGVNLTDEALFVRLYSNAYFNSDRSNDAYPKIEVAGGRPANQAALLALQQKLITWQKRPQGKAYAFINGRQAEMVNPFNTKFGDAVELVYDASIYRTLEFTIGDLEKFNSTLDDNYKFLLHYPGVGDNIIDYQDDIDVFVMGPVQHKLRSGVYYHRNRVDAMRMLTHKDYSVPVAYVTGYAEEQGWETPEECVLRLHVRKSGWDRPLVFEHQRIHELYKLPDADLVRAMIGLNSTVEVWQAPVLEASMYTWLMRAPNREAITLDRVEKAYGYNAISVLVGDTPSKPVPYGTIQIVQVPVALREFSTGYEYDAAGILQASYRHSGGDVYGTRSADTRLVELFSGIGGDELDEIYGQQTSPIDSDANYRFYVCPMDQGVPTNVWTDVTGSGQYAVTDNQVQWLTNPQAFYTLVRSDKKFLSYEVAIPPVDGLIVFTVMYYQIRNGLRVRRAMEVQLGELDFFLNGRSLIENLDYRMIGNVAIINNKTYLRSVNGAPIDDSLQRVRIRFTGFCNKDLSRDIPDDVGFVAYDVLSHNTRYDLRDDRVLRITADGRTFDRADLRFAEDDVGVSIADVPNGAPYEIRDIVVPLRGSTGDDTYTLRAVSQAVDKSISDYLTLFFPQPEPEGLDVIPRLYAVFSPFCCKILYDLKSGVLNDPRIYTRYNDGDLDDILAKYLYLLDYDPAAILHGYDPNYVIVHPHNLYTVIDVELAHYRFLTRVVKVYLHDNVVLSHFLRLTEF